MPLNSRISLRAAACTALLFAAIVNAQEGALFRVKCGGEGFVDKSGHIWEADAHYEGGQTFAAATDIVNTDIPFLYQSERWNDATTGNLKYTFNVRPGGYRVNLHFAEIYEKAFAAGQRVFDVKVNETVVAPDLDIFAQAGANTPLILDFLAPAIDGRITIEFLNKIGNAKIAGIEVIPQNPFRAVTAPYRIHCGGEDFIDPQGNYWEGDGHFSGGNTMATANLVGGTDKSFLYQTERWNGAGDLTYGFDVEPGGYAVRLHFAEIFFQAAGLRSFGVDINGTSAIENLDVAAEAGPNIALVKEFAVTATDGRITIGFRNGSENAKISGIEILSTATVGTRNGGGTMTGALRADIRTAGAGSLTIAPGFIGNWTATVRDLQGAEVASARGAGRGSLSGLRPGIYLIELRSGSRAFVRRLPIF